MPVTPPNSLSRLNALTKKKGKKHPLRDHQRNQLPDHAYTAPVCPGEQQPLLTIRRSGGDITISTRNFYNDKPFTGFEVVPEGEYAVLEISDRGIGMPHTDLEKIFEPFYTKKVMGRSGSGLGMSVVWGTVKDHDGFIDIITQEGTGTTFVLYFPASRSEEKKPASVYVDDYLGKGESILIVDDVPEQRELAKRMMQRLGYDVHTGKNRTCGQIGTGSGRSEKLMYIFT